MSVALNPDKLAELIKAALSNAAAIDRVRELHKPKQLSIVWTGCEICWEHPNTRGTSYPCPTIKALDGE